MNWVYTSVFMSKFEKLVATCPGTTRKIWSKVLQIWQLRL